MTALTTTMIEMVKKIDPVPAFVSSQLLDRRPTRNYRAPRNARRSPDADLYVTPTHGSQLT